jgi:hypothetical protein
MTSDYERHGVDCIIVYMIHAYLMLVIWVDPFWYSSLPYAIPLTIPSHSRYLTVIRNLLI